MLTLILTFISSKNKKQKTNTFDLDFDFFTAFFFLLFIAQPFKNGVYEFVFSTHFPIYFSAHWRPTSSPNDIGCEQKSIGVGYCELLSQEPLENMAWAQQVNAEWIKEWTQRVKQRNDLYQMTGINPCQALLGVTNTCLIW